MINIIPKYNSCARNKDYRKAFLSLFSFLIFHSTHGLLEASELQELNNLINGITTIGSAKEGLFLNQLSSGTPEVILFLKSNALSSSTPIRHTASKGLLKLKIPCEDTVEIIPKLLIDENSLVRKSALIYTGQSHCKNHNAILLKRLALEKDNKVLQQALRITGVVGDNSFQEILTNTQNSINSPIETRLCALEALALLDLPYDQLFLKSQLQSSNRANVIGALTAFRMTKNNENIELLKPFTEKLEPENSLALIAIHSIRLRSEFLYSDEKIRFLFSLLNHPNNRLRKWSVHRLITDHMTPPLVTELKKKLFLPEEPAFNEIGEALLNNNLITFEEASNISVGVQNE